MKDRGPLAPWIQHTPLELYSLTAAPQIGRTQSVDDPIASAVIDSLRFELENSQQMVMHLQQELRRERGDSDDE